MLIYQENALQKFMYENMEINPDWAERDFVSYTRKYFQKDNFKILAIGGLRGTGKTTGLLQAISKLHDAVYITAQKGEIEDAADYIDFLKKTDAKYIIIDEYSWIQNRKALDEYLFTAVQNGKRIVITGTESITLDFLNYSSMIHRVDMVHVTLFTYDEYCRIYHQNKNKKSCKAYLQEGGVFREYAITNYDTMRGYIQTAIIDNLTAYMHETLETQKAAALVYAVLYKAVCPSNLRNIPVLTENKLTLDNFLDVMGIDTEVTFTEGELAQVADILTQIGVIVRIPNIDTESPIKEQYYVTNPSITCQLILAAYQIPEVTNEILGHVFESSCLVHLYYHKLSEHQLYFVNTTIHDRNKELDGVIVSEGADYVYLFECKFREQDTISPNATIMSKDIEDMFPDSIIAGRYVLYNGKPSLKILGDKSVIFTPMDDEIMDSYYYFDQAVEKLQTGK